MFFTVINLFKIMLFLKTVPTTTGTFLCNEMPQVISFLAVRSNYTFASVTTPWKGFLEHNHD